MSFKTQAKILRILQDQKFERVGGSQTITVDVRIIAATNKDLKAEIQANRFREDLYYRLKVVPFHVPPLRERKEDVPLLAQHFFKEFCAIHGKPPIELSKEAINVLLAYSWPGNVRELKNLIERIVILSTASEEDRLVSAATLLSHLQDESSSLRSEGAVVDVPGESSSSQAKNLRDARQEFEKDFILKTLKENDWNVSRTASILGIERSHLHRKIKSFGIET
jgi:two-component system, NtrC family, nitrogen regulation response regulator NtrX